MVDEDYTRPVGVSTSLLLILVEKCAGLPAGYTTKDACDRVVLPITQAKKCAFIDMYRDKKDHRGKPYVAPATAFGEFQIQFIDNDRACTCLPLMVCDK